LAVWYGRKRRWGGFEFVRKCREAVHATGHLVGLRGWELWFRVCRRLLLWVSDDTTTSVCVSL
jgi:hypothetical protein